jgi:hypothetical protein
MGVRYDLSIILAKFLFACCVGGGPERFPHPPGGFGTEVGRLEKN